MRARRLRVNAGNATEKGDERRRFPHRNRTDGYLLRQLRVLITYDYKFNRMSPAITVAEIVRERTRTRARCIILSYRACPFSRFMASICHILKTRPLRITK